MGGAWSGKISRNSDWRQTRKGMEEFQGGRSVSEETRGDGMGAEVLGSESGGFGIGSE
jgi:hypothetical protein